MPLLGDPDGRRALTDLDVEIFLELRSSNCEHAVLRAKDVMNRILVADYHLIAVWVYPERKLVHHVMKKYCYGADFRNGLMKGLEAMRLHKATKWLSDNSLSTGALPRDDEEWADNVWFPSAKAAGWKHWGIVQSAQKISQLNIERISRKFSDLGITARLFNDADEAMKWLDEV